MGEQVISFTPAAVVWLCGAIIAISGAVGVIAKAVDRLKAPNKTQDERISSLESWKEEVTTMFAEHARHLDNDKKRLDAIEEGNRVTQRAIMALMGHFLNGNDVDKLKEAKDQLESYLISK